MRRFINIALDISTNRFKFNMLFGVCTQAQEHTRDSTNNKSLNPICRIKWYDVCEGDFDDMN